ncbi:hypothetical protein EYF80_033705 [Liparis tanakae]|uniref:Uncharacterized protein n=1 Tax=Liparis tanakae TaxID=230148 RepID=A0A4Z2GTY8_9TELE|nr:hypothetical protein EYF80_033705 [Liparis tanakae]
MTEKLEPPERDPDDPYNRSAAPHAARVMTAICLFGLLRWPQISNSWRLVGSRGSEMKNRDNNTRLWTDVGVLETASSWLNPDDFILEFGFTVQMFDRKP